MISLHVSVSKNSNHETIVMNEFFVEMMKYFILKNIAEFFRTKLEQQLHQKFLETRFIVNKILNH